MSRHGWLDGILEELKGTTLRRGFRTTATTRQRKQAIGFLDGLVRLLERHECRIVGRVWVKQLDVPIDGMALHVSSLRFICAAFHAGLADDERGMVLTDSQTYQHNHRLAHAIFTQRFARRPSHERLLDMPVFGHSDNHAGLQLADLLCHPWRDPREGRERFSLAIHDPLKRSTQRMWGAAKPSYDVI